MHLLEYNCFISLSRDHGPSGQRHEYNLPPPPPADSYVRHDIDKETCARAVDKHKQHALPSAISNYSSKNSKRHSMDAEVLMSLRRDSDALLQRRESLLRLRKFSEGMASPNILVGSTPATRRSPVTQSKHTTLLLEKDKPYIKMDEQYDKHNSPIADISSALRSTTITDEKYLKRVRSVSFPDHSQRKHDFNHNRGKSFFN